MKQLTISIPSFPASIPALSFGDPNKPLLLALHGWLDNAASFVALAPLLKKHHVIAIDLPGHGLFDHTSFQVAYQVDNYMKLIIQLIDTLSQKPIALMGHSLGGAIASVIAARYPDKICKLILIDVLGPLSADMLATNPNLQTNAEAMRTAAQYASTKVYPSLKDMIHVRMKANMLTAHQAKPLVERGAQQSDGQWAWSFDSRITHSSSFYYPEKEVLELLTSIQCPVLVIAGKEGIFKGREYYEKRLTTIKRLTFHEIDGSHHVHMQSQEQVAQCINHFLEESLFNRNN